MSQPQITDQQFTSYGRGIKTHTKTYVLRHLSGQFGTIQKSNQALDVRIMHSFIYKKVHFVNLNGRKEN